GPVLAAVGVDLRDEIFVAGKHDDQNEIGSERQIDERQNRENDVLDIGVQEPRKRFHELMPKSHQQHEQCNDEADVKRRQNPAGLENSGFENFLDGVLGH